jgi:hypothetical protein
VSPPPAGYDRSGWDPASSPPAGYDRSGWDGVSSPPAGYDRSGWDGVSSPPAGYDRSGWDPSASPPAGYERQGWAEPGPADPSDGGPGPEGWEQGDVWDDHRRAPVEDDEWAEPDRRDGGRPRRRPGDPDPADRRGRDW